jgi:hypothetical protein
MTLVNPDGVLLLGGWCPHSLWREWYEWSCGCLSRSACGRWFAYIPLEVSGVLDDSSIVNAACGSTIMLYASIKAGGAYINVHSGEPTGEVRGQIGQGHQCLTQRRRRSTCHTSSVTGTATIDLLADSTIEYFVNPMNPDGVLLLGVWCHIHCGASGVNGDVVAFLSACGRWVHHRYSSLASSMTQYCE